MIKIINIRNVGLMSSEETYGNSVGELKAFLLEAETLAGVDRTLIFL